MQQHSKVSEVKRKNIHNQNQSELSFLMQITIQHCIFSCIIIVTKIDSEIFQLSRRQNFIK